MKVTVYGLFSTRDGAVRYIGQTVQSLAQRLRQHRCYAKLRRSTAVHKWFTREVDDGYEIKMTALANDAVLHVTEIALIAAHRQSGCALLNHTDGGEGTIGWRGNAGNKRPDLAERNRSRKGLPGHPSTPEANAKIAAAHKGKLKPWVSERNKAATGKPGHRHTDESRAKISGANKGHVVTPEWRAKISAANKGKKLTEPQIAALRAAHKRYYAEKKNAI